MNRSRSPDLDDLINERKLVADARREEFGRAWLSHVCAPDLEHAVGRVFTVYYDTLALASYWEKVNGDFVKSKVRLRWYDRLEGPPDRAEAFLEVKLRAGAGRWKWRTPLVLSRTWLDQLSLDDEALRELPYRQGGDLVERLPPDLYPAVTVSYDRRRFVCPLSGARIALDTSISASAAHGRLRPAARSCHLDAVVIEIKAATNDEIAWLEPLYRRGFRHRAFSKYLACMSGIGEGVAR